MALWRKQLEGGVVKHGALSCTLPSSQTALKPTPPPSLLVGA